MVAMAGKQLAAPAGVGRDGNGPRDRPPVTKPTSELEQAIQRYVDLYDFAPIAYFSFDSVGHIKEANLAATQLLDRRRRDLIGSPFAVHVAKEDTGLFLNHLLRCRSSEARVETELRLKNRHGEIIFGCLSSIPIASLIKDGAMLYQTAVVDLTERKRAEERLAEQTRLLDLSNDAILVHDADERITYWNHGAEEIYGYRREEALGKVTHELLRTEHPQPLERIRKKLHRNNRWSGELVHTRKNGAKIVVMSRWVLDRDGQGKPTFVLETNTDITERKKAEANLKKAKDLLESSVQEQTAELRATNKELEKEIHRRKGLEGKILEISDREQQRLGTELHDGLCQHLTATAFMARATAQRLKNHRVIEVSDIEKIAALVNGAASDARDIARGLHRVDVDAAGLVKALQDLVDRELWPTPCRLEVRPSFHFEDDNAAVHLYRIAREAVINANKHAQAREVVIKLERSRNGIVLSVTDNGVGLVDKPDRARGLGFHIMDSRARAAGGCLEVEARKQRGTRVACYVPHTK